MSAAPHHVTESISDRKKSRELAEARQSGAIAPAVDSKTGAMINPHNPEFITKRPWYLGGDGAGGAGGGGAEAGMSLDHQADQRLDKDRIELSMASADKALKAERDAIKEAQKKNSFQVGMWVEALRNNKQPYRICKVTSATKKGKHIVLDLEYEDGKIERKVKVPKKDTKKSRSLFSEKPRVRMTKTGARNTKLDAAVYGKETYDSKRDKYHGYDYTSHTKKVEKIFEERAAIRKAVREKQKEKLMDKNKDSSDKDKKAALSDADSDDSDVDSDVGSSDGEDSDDEFVQRDEDAKVITSRLARQGGVGGAQMKVTARNLRIREDTAKYLRNLDLDSAYYDPKSRSMRDNPNPELGAEESPFVGDNFTRISGDAVKLADTQLFAWNATDRGVGEIHPQANPSQAELLKKTFQTKAATIQRHRQKAVLDKYGGSEYLDGSGGLAKASAENDGEGHTKKKSKADKELSVAQERKIRFGVSTVAEEYSRDGRLLKGQHGKSQPTAPVKSKYEEDIFINGHTTVWGSYFHIGAFQWGYGDDHSLIRSSYCTGANGRVANDEANEMRYGTGVAGSAALAQARGMLKALPKSGSTATSSTTNEPPSMTMSKLYGEADVSSSVGEAELQEAMKKAAAREKEQNGERKRKYNSMHSEVDVTEADMEAYRLRKDRGDDPMSKISSEELLEY